MTRDRRRKSGSETAGRVFSEKFIILDCRVLGDEIIRSGLSFQLITFSDLIGMELGWDLNGNEVDIPQMKFESLQIMKKNSRKRSMTISSGDSDSPREEYSSKDMKFDSIVTGQ